MWQVRVRRKYGEKMGKLDPSPDLVESLAVSMLREPPPTRGDLARTGKFLALALRGYKAQAVTMVAPKKVRPVASFTTAAIIPIRAFMVYSFRRSAPPFLYSFRCEVTERPPSCDRSK